MTHQIILDNSARNADLDDMAKKATHPRASDQLRDIIRDCELSRYEISKRTGIDQSALTRFMSGERGLSMEALDTLAEYLELDIISRRRSKGARAK